MKRRAFVVLYSIFIIALVFIVIVSLTDTNINRSLINHYYKDRIKSKYITESSIYGIINELDKRGYFDELLLRFARKNKSPENDEILQIDIQSEARLINPLLKRYANGDMILSFESVYNGIRYSPKIRFKTYNDLFDDKGCLYKVKRDDEEYLAFINSDIISECIEYMLFLDEDKRMEIKTMPFAYRFIEGEENLEIENSDSDNKDMQNQIEDIDENKGESFDNPDNSKSEENDSQTGLEEDETEENQEDNDDRESDEEDKEISQDTEENSDEEIQPDKFEDEEKNEKEESEFIEPSANYSEYFIGSNIIYRNENTYINGIVKFDSNTIIDSDIEITGLLIIFGEPEHRKGDIKVNGGIITEVDLPNYIELNPIYSRFAKYASVYKGFIDPRIESINY
ncbi:MAG: hypothetical protein Q4P34_02140 [Tissierellia bacterium]|nr:hypothetical protein [Tissierellia bacterium]